MPWLAFFCRFEIGVSESLVDFVQPKLKAFQDKAQAAVDAAAQGTADHEQAALVLNLAHAIRQMTIAAVQDAVVLADKYPDNDFHIFLEGHEEFK